jgi:hypothetical protein
MKKISKNKLDSLICVSRLYWNSGDTCLLPARTAIAQAIEEETKKSFCTWTDLIDGALKLNPEADNRTIYMIIKFLGWDVVSDG